MRCSHLSIKASSFQVITLQIFYRCGNVCIPMAKKYSLMRLGLCARSGAECYFAEARKVTHFKSGQVLRCVHELLPRKPPIDSTDQELVKCLSKLLRLEPSLAMQSVDSLLPLLRSEGHEGVGLACRAFAACAAVCRDAGDRALEVLMSELVRGECSNTARQYILRSAMQVSSSSVTRWRACQEVVAAASRQMLDADPWVGYKLGKYAMANGVGLSSLLPSLPFFLSPSLLSHLPFSLSPYHPYHLSLRLSPFLSSQQHQPVQGLTLCFCRPCTIFRGMRLQEVCLRSFTLE